MNQITLARRGPATVGAAAVAAVMNRLLTSVFGSPPSMKQIVLTIGLAAALSIAPHGQPASREHLLLVVSQTDNKLVVYKVEGRALSPAGTIPIGNGVREVCVSADGNRAYASNDKDNSVTAIDLETLKPIATIPLTGLQRPDGCGTSPDSKKLYVTAMDSNAVAVISTATNKMLKAVKVAKEPRRVLFSPDNRRIFISSEVSDEITVLSARTDMVIDRMRSGGHGPRTMMYLPDKKTMLTTNVDDDTVSFIKLATKRPYLTIGAGGSPQRLGLSRDGGSVFVLSVLEHKISIIDVKGEHIRAKKFVPVAEQPWGMTMNDDASLLFVGSSKDGTVTAYDTTSWEVAAKATGLNRPMGIAYR